MDMFGFFFEKLVMRSISL